MESHEQDTDIAPTTMTTLIYMTHGVSWCVMRVRLKQLMIYNEPPSPSPHVYSYACSTEACICRRLLHTVHKFGNDFAQFPSQLTHTGITIYNTQCKPLTCIRHHTRRMWECAQ